MKLHNIIVLAVAGAVNLGLAIPAVVATTSGLNARNAPSIEEPEDLTGVTAAKIIKEPNKTVYQEEEYFDPTGMMCLITQNGTKKMARENFEVVDPHPLGPDETSARVRYGDFEFDVPLKVLKFVSVLDINYNGEYTIQAEDPRIPIDGYIEADPAWSAAHYDGVNEVTKFVESWENHRCSPSSGQSLANVAVGSVLGFKFTLAKPATITISANMAMYDTKKPADLLEFALDGEVRDDVDKNLILTHLDAEDNGARYFNWQTWSMGTYELGAGNHSFTLKVVEFKLPNLDSFTITAHGMEGGDLINITGNGSQTLEATNPNLDRTNWIKDSANYDFVENWSNGGATYLGATSGTSIGHLAAGSHISFSLGLSGRARVTLKPIIAHVEAAVASSYLEVSIDGTKMNVEDFGQDRTTTLGSSGVSTYWNWKGWNSGTMDLTKGSHVVLIKVLKSCNIYGFEAVASNYAAGEYGAVTIKGNGSTTLQAESSLLNRSGWSVDSGFVQAGREPVETWNAPAGTAANATTGRSLCGLNPGCEIVIPFESRGSASLNFNIIVAKYESINVSNTLEVKLDGEVLANNDTSLQISGTANNQWFNWNNYNAGQANLTAGEHVIVIKLIGQINIDSFIFNVSNFAA